jgi:hypothetical protein
MEERLEVWSWPIWLKAPVEYFIRGAKIITANRNIIIHSDMFAVEPDQVIFLKSNKKGETEGITLSLTELEAICSEFTTMIAFGMNLNNSIHRHVLERPTYTMLGDGLPSLARFPLPDKPPLPCQLRYKSRS